jgi:hypothetical protein
MYIQIHEYFFNFTIPHIAQTLHFLEHICRKTNPCFIHFIFFIPTMGIWLIHNVAFVANTLNPRLLVFLLHFS